MQNWKVGSIWNFERLFIDNQLTNLSKFQIDPTFRSYLLKWANEDWQTSSTGHNWLGLTLTANIPNHSSTINLKIIFKGVRLEFLCIMCCVALCDTWREVSASYSSNPIPIISRHRSYPGIADPINPGMRHRSYPGIAVIISSASDRRCLLLEVPVMCTCNSNTCDVARILYPTGW